MIILHKMNGDEFILNANHIETMEAKPDTVLTLTNDRKYLVKETIEEIIERIAEYQRSIYLGIETRINCR
ncbi:MAG: flagellar FlbD family protein [Spirochaetota bacterium]|nr:flagellar FlbD family protein [Spirochaetota bacterium]